MRKKKGAFKTTLLRNQIQKFRTVRLRSPSGNRHAHPPAAFRKYPSDGRPILRHDPGDFPFPVESEGDRHGRDDEHHGRSEDEISGTVSKEKDVNVFLLG